MPSDNCTDRDTLGDHADPAESLPPKDDAPPRWRDVWDGYDPPMGDGCLLAVAAIVFGSAFGALFALGLGQGVLP